MNYRPDTTELRLWDTWVCFHEESSLYHLFYLACRPGGHWHWVGHAVSSDMVHWREVEPIRVNRPNDSYDVGVIGTGMVFPDGSGKYAMSVTFNLDGARQSIGFLVSDDLYHWEKKWPEPRIFADGTFYEDNPARSFCQGPAFRDAFVFQREGTFHALIAAQAAREDSIDRGVVAEYVSEDLRDWQPRAPMLGPGITMLVEVPEHFELNGKHYLIYSTHSGLGVRVDTESRKICSGTFYALADRYEGPYRCPQDNMLIGAGEQSVVQSYVGRIMWHQETPLLYHHINSSYPAFALPKRVLQESDGSLYGAVWDQAVEKLWGKELAPGLGTLGMKKFPETAGEAQVSGETLCVDAHDIITSVFLDTPPLSDFHLRFQVRWADCQRFSVSLRCPGPEGDKACSAWQADIENGVWQLGSMIYNWFGFFGPDERVKSDIQMNTPYRIDIIVRDVFVEIYVDERWMFTRNIEMYPRAGVIAFNVERGTAEVTGLEIHELEPMLHGTAGAS